MRDPYRDKTKTLDLRHLETRTNFKLRVEVSGLSERMAPASLLVDSQVLESKARGLIRRHVAGGGWEYRLLILRFLQRIKRGTLTVLQWRCGSCILILHRDPPLLGKDKKGR